MNDNDIKRNIIVSVVGLVIILSLLLFLIFSVGSEIDFYLLLIMELGIILFIILLIGSLKERKKKKKLLQELDDELKEDK
ncbi:oligosaccharide repeat unit polymerase [Lactococcus lactis subsp. lactis]|nr:oligosaccharide repeat unit polymerase [Lactococcus lactis subsp. lactis]